MEQLLPQANLVVVNLTFCSKYYSILINIISPRVSRYSCYRLGREGLSSCSGNCFAHSRLSISNCWSKWKCLQPICNEEEAGTVGLWPPCLVSWCYFSCTNAWLRIQRLLFQGTISCAWRDDAGEGVWGSGVWISSTLCLCRVPMCLLLPALPARSALGILSRQLQSRALVRLSCVNCSGSCEWIRTERSPEV